MTVQKMLNTAELFGCKLPIAKAEFAKMSVPRRVLNEFGEAIEVINSYREDYPDELLKGFQTLIEKGLYVIHQRALENRWADYE